jgi:TorA maturation chaperone TorD
MTDDPALDLARECLYRFLAAALTDPHARGWRLLFNAQSQQLARQAADLLRAEAEAKPVPLAPGELPAEELNLAPLLAEFARPVQELRGDYDRAFGLVASRECPLYETEYHHNGDTFFRSQQMADVAGFYRAFGLEPACTSPERPDHLALELEFMAFLLLKKRLAQAAAEYGNGRADAVAVCDQAQRQFFRDHLAWWVPAFATGLRRKAGSGFYAQVGRVLAALLPSERARFGVAPPRASLQLPLIESVDEEPTACAGCAS